MTDHAGVRSRLEHDGVLVHEGYCSCRHVTDAHPGPEGKLTAAGELLTHLRDCPDEVDNLDVSQATEAWAERRYPWADDGTLTFDEWQARYG